jgi:recombination protein RecA
MAARKKTENVESESRATKVLASEALAKILKAHGSEILIRASDHRHQEVPRIPSGIMMLDWGLGGGWPAGRINIIYGHKSSSKTTTLMKTIANAQKMCAACFTFPNVDLATGEIGECKCGEFRESVCAFIDVEGTLDMKWARNLGVDPDRLLLSQPEFAEASLDIGEALIRSGEVDVIVLDSLAFLTPAKEIEESVEKETMGVQPRLIGKGIRKFNAALSAVKNEHGRYPTVFFTNQIRMKLGVMFGNPETQPGGMAPGFAATTEVKVWPGKYLIDEKTGRPVHVDINFRIEKNKSAPAKMEGEFRLMLTDTETKHAGDIYEEDAIVNMSQKFGLLEGHGNSWTCLGEKYGGKSVIERKLLTDPAYKKTLKDALMKVLLAA